MMAYQLKNYFFSASGLGPDTGTRNGSQRPSYLKAITTHICAWQGMHRRSQRVGGDSSTSTVKIVPKFILGAVDTSHNSRARALPWCARTLGRTGGAAHARQGPIRCITKRGRCVTVRTRPQAKQIGHEDASAAVMAVRTSRVHGPRRRYPSSGPTDGPAARHPKESPSWQQVPLNQVPHVMHEVLHLTPVCLSR